MASALIHILLLAGGMVIVGLILELYFPIRSYPLERFMVYRSPRWSALPVRQQYLLFIISNGLFNAGIVLGALILSRTLFGEWNGRTAIAFGLALWVNFSIDALRRQRRSTSGRANPLSSTDEHPPTAK